MRFVSFVLILGVSAAAQLPESWKHWQCAAPVELGPASEARLVAVPIPAAVTARAAEGWRDVRLIDAEGREVPFFLHARLGGRTTVAHAARLLEPGFVPGRYTQVVLDLGADPGIHNAVRLGLDGTDDLQTRVEVATSADGATWQVVEDGEPVFRLKGTGAVAERLDVPYPDSRSRYIRLRILEGARRVLLRSARVTHEVVTTTERVAADAGFTPAPDAARPGTSLWLSRADLARRPMSQVRFEATDALFSRRVTVEAAGVWDSWRHVATGDIGRTLAAGQARTVLSIEFPEAMGRAWRVSVADGNDPPVPGLVPALYETPRRLVFRQEPGQSYRVIYGHSRAAAPAYDLERRTDAAAIEAAVSGSLGAESVNAGYEDPAPWTERNPYLLWVVLALVVIGLGAMALRTLRASTPRSGGP